MVMWHTTLPPAQDQVLIIPTPQGDTAEGQSPRTMVLLTHPRQPEGIPGAH